VLKLFARTLLPSFSASRIKRIFRKLLNWRSRSKKRRKNWVKRKRNRSLPCLDYSTRISHNLLFSILSSASSSEGLRKQLMASFSKEALPTASDAEARNKELLISLESKLKDLVSTTLTCIVVIPLVVNFLCDRTVDWKLSKTSMRRSAALWPR
jgi:hypothetical protein